MGRKNIGLLDSMAENIFDSMGRKHIDTLDYMGKKHFDTLDSIGQKHINTLDSMAENILDYMGPKYW